MKEPEGWIEELGRVMVVKGAGLEEEEGRMEEEGGCLTKVGGIDEDVEGGI